ncbi:hypothetical protein [Costertonia aggregata]|uniref:Uncharacterized protein n=1 Tax=Costertonia aggregata TaxID=343403 RepID=A0A7H9ATX8_9FLAO|nr:hypothetical protein [Costertonia aggregata]QLG46928.1 hypothetical protein HYG79_16730 [Costertonia aggregata]
MNKLIPGVLFSVFFCYTIVAQENLRFKGELTVSKYRGNADYGYTIIDGDTLLNGRFRLKKANLDSLLNKQDYSFDFSGSFENNYPNGYWTFQFGEFQSNNESQVIDYQYRVAVNGVQEEASGSITKGKPDGSWTYVVHKIEDSKVSQTLFKSTIDFNNGVPQKSFRIENDSLVLAGRFLRNGLAHDEWSLYDAFGLGASENWLFSNGVLNEINYEANGNRKTSRIYGAYSGSTKTINLDKKYIKAIAVYQFASSDSSQAVGGKMQQLLAQNATYYKKIDTILSSLGESAFLPEFKVKVPYFKLSDQENRQLMSISENYRNANEISTSFLADTQLNILKLSDDNAAFYYETIKKIKEDFLRPVAKLLRYNDEGVIEFAPRQQLIQKLWPTGKPSTTIEVIIESNTVKNSRSFRLDTTDEFNFSGNNLRSVVQLSEYALKSLNTIKDQLDKRLTNERRQQELVSIEERLIASQKELHARIDSAVNNSPSSVKKALYALKNHSDEALSSYSSLTAVSPKLVEAKKLVSCYTQLNVLAKNIGELPEQEEAIKEKYQDRIWNPFMATLMDEEVKKRITSAYRKTLVPYFLSQAQDEFECEKVKALNVLIKDTYKRMLELRVENTSKLERKLRKETDPLRVLALFELQPIPKEQ